MKKQVITLTIFSILLSLFITSYAFAQQPVQVFLNGEKINFINEPIIENGTTLVEFRTIFEKLGYKVSWDQTTSTVSSYKDGLAIQLRLRDYNAVVNGQYKQLPAAPRIINGKTLVPIRFIAETSGLNVEWDNGIIHIGNQKDAVYHKIGYITDVYEANNGKRYINIDFIEFYMFDQAVTEALKDGYAEFDEDGTPFVCNDYYIRNPDTIITTLEIAKDANIGIYNFDSNITLANISFEQFKNAFRYGEYTLPFNCIIQLPYYVEIKNNVVIKITQQYLS